MENNLKTAEEIINDPTVIAYDQTPAQNLYSLEQMQAYARQALEAYRDELLQNLTRVTVKDTSKAKYKIGQLILNTELDNFIK